MKNKSSQMLDRYIRARYPIIAIMSHEESRVMSSILDVAENMTLTTGRKSPRTVVAWSLTQGLKAITKTAPAAGLPSPEASSAPIAALKYIAEFDETGEEAPVLFVMKDIHRILSNDIKAVRFLRDIAARFETRRHSLIMLSPEVNLPTDIEKTAAIIDWSLPDADELQNVLRLAENELDAELNTLNGNRDQIIQAMRGLTRAEAENALTAGIVACGKLSDEVLPFILNEKKQIIRKSGVLEYFEATVTMSDVGGLENLKTYAERKRKAMSSEARSAGVDSPKGVLLVGPPGVGKSLSAKAIAGGEYPLLRLDMGKMLGGGRVGEAENNITAALKVTEAIAPCVLWIDEAEKALADNGGASDGGVMMRIIGSLLTWMQETTAPVYTVATVNGASLRPELLSRFDDVMFVDLPDAKSREEILRVHLTKRNVKKIADLKSVVDATWGFSGREIEKTVKFAVERAFFSGKSVTAAHLLASASGIVPTSETKRDEIEALREWAKGKALLAGNPLEEKPQASIQKQKLEI